MVAIILSLITFAHASISFDQALTKIAEQSPTFKNQQEKVSAQESERLSKVMSFLPSLSASYGKDHSYNSDLDSYSSSIALSANLFKGGSDFSSASSSFSLLESERKQLSQTEIESQANALNLLVNYILSSKKVSIVNELLSIQKNSLDISQKRYARGLIPKQEMEKAEVDVYNSEARLMNAQMELETYKKQVESYLSQEKVKIDWPYTKGLLDGRTRPKIQESNSRKDLETLKSYVSSMESVHNSRYGAFVPQVDLGYRLVNSSVESGFFADSGVEDKILSINFTWTLFNGFRDRAALAQSRYYLEESRNRLIDLEREVSASRKTKGIVFNTALESLRKRLKTLELSRRIYRQSVRRFQEGKLSFNDLEIDQNRYLETELLAQEGEAQVHRTLADYCSEYGLSILSCL